MMKFKTLAQYSLIGLSLFLSACSSIHRGTLENRSALLADGIQKTYRVNANTASRVAPLIIQSADRHNVSPSLLAAVIQQESTYRSQVTSHAGAVGLMQVIPKYWQKQCPGNLYDEATNIQCGASIIHQYEKRAGNLKKALGYYNVGPAGYENNRKMRKQGKKYAKSVLKHEKKLKAAL